MRSMPVPSLLLLFLLALPLAAQTPRVVSFPLERTRAVWFVQADNPVGAEVGFAWEKLPWNDRAALAWDLASREASTRVALTGFAWPALETFTELTFGTVRVKPGGYYVVLDRDRTGWRLGLLDADKVRRARLPPGTADGTALVAAIPLALTGGEGGSRPLHVGWQPAPGGGSVVLELQWGPHTWRAEAKVRGSEGASPIALPDARRATQAAWVPADTFQAPRNTPSAALRTPRVTIDHGVIAWNDERAAAAKAMQVGTRWRLGKDWATTLDTNVPLRLGGKKLAAGCWHLALARTADGWNLVVSSAVADYANRLDGFAAQHVQAVLELPLERASQEPPAAELAVRLVADGDALRLEIAFGPERWSLPVAIG